MISSQGVNWAPVYGGFCIFSATQKIQVRPYFNPSRFVYLALS